MAQLKKLYFFFIIFLLLSIIPTSLASITFTAPTSFTFGDAHLTFNDATPLTVNSFNVSDYAYLDDDQIKIDSANASVTAWFRDNWFNYTVDGNGNQYVSHLRKLLSVYFDNVATAVGYTYEYPFTNVTGATTGQDVSLHYGDIGLKFPFDNETSSTQTLDWGTSDNDGTIVGATRSYDGHFGMSTVYDGTDYITVADADSLDFDSAVTLSAWIKPTTITESSIIDKPNSYSLLLLANGGVSFKINDQYFNTSASLIATGNWYHIVGTYDGSTANVYIDRVLRVSTAYSSAIVTSAFDVIVGYEFVGNIDEVRVTDSYTSAIYDTIALYPYVYQSLIDTTACSWLVSTLNYNFTNIFIRQNSSYPLTTTKFNFTDTVSEMGLEWTSGTYITYTGLIANSTAKLTFVSKSYATSSNAGILQASVKIETSVQSTANVDVYLYCKDSLNREDDLTIPDRFSIYGIGGLITYEVAGDGAPILGGSILDVMAMNSSLLAGGSYAKTSTIAPNFQHVHQLVHISQNTFYDGASWDEPTYQHETAWIAFGVDYMFSNCTWTTGWYVNITTLDGLADANNGWVQLNCSWYNAGDYIKSDIIYAMYEAYNGTESTTQFSLWIDLWLSQDAGSSMVGGHVSSAYYGMTKTGWWLWETYAPVAGLASSSTFYDFLYDQNGDITTASTLKIFRVWDEVAKVASGVDDNSDACIWAIQNEILQIITQPYIVTLVGIMTPVFQPTTTPDMPVGFFASLANFLADALKNLQAGFASMIQTGSSVGASAVNSVALQFGVADLTGSIATFLTGIGGFFATSVTYIIDLLTSFFALLASIALFLITWLGGIITWIINIGSAMTSLLTTGSIGTIVLLPAIDLGIITEVLGTLGTFVTTGFIFIVLIVWWFDSIDSRAKRYGGGWMGFFMSDIQSLISIFSFILDLAWRVVSTVIDLTMRTISFFA